MNVPANDPAPKQTHPASGGDSATLHAVVYGQVQGVGFRFFVLREGRRLQLTGFVRNLSDGRVEVFARGPRPALEDLAQRLRQGPMFSRVEEVELKWNVPVPPASEFEIR